VAPPRRSDPPPLETADVLTVGIGTALWALAFLALLPFRDTLADDGREWWLWTCVAGFGLGLYGVYYVRRRRERLRQRGVSGRDDQREAPREPLT